MAVWCPLHCLCDREQVELTGCLSFLGSAGVIDFPVQFPQMCITLHSGEERKQPSLPSPGPAQPTESFHYQDKTACTPTALMRREGLFRGRERERRGEMGKREERGERGGPQGPLPVCMRFRTKPPGHTGSPEKLILKVKCHILKQAS